MKSFVSFLTAILLSSFVRLSADDPTLPHKIEVSEDHEKYYAIAALDSHDPKQFIGFKIFDSKDHFIQLINYPLVDLAYEGPAYTFSSLHFEDFNFDGYPDIALPGDGSTAHAHYYGIWLWDPKQKKFVENDELNEAQITRINPKNRHLYSDYSYHGFSSTSEYKYLSGKLVLLFSDVIDPQKNSEVKKFYSDGKITKTVTSELKSPQ